MFGPAIRRNMMVGAAAVGVLATTLASSGAAEAAPTASNVCYLTGYTPNTLVMGSAKVTKTFAIQTQNPCTPIDWEVTVLPYNTSGNENTGISATVQVPSITFDPKSFANVDAGVHPTGAIVYVELPRHGGQQLIVPFTVARAATFGKTLDATPEPVKKGKKITVKATLKRISWTYASAKKMPYVSYSGQPVDLQFKAKGASTFTTVKTVKTTAGGKFSTTVTASKSGAWRVSYAGNATTGSAVSSTDAVTVK